MNTDPFTRIRSHSTKRVRHYIECDSSINVIYLLLHCWENVVSSLLFDCVGKDFVDTADKESGWEILTSAKIAISDI